MSDIMLIISIIALVFVTVAFIIVIYIMCWDSIRGLFIKPSKHELKITFTESKIKRSGQYVRDINGDTKEIVTKGNYCYLAEPLLKVEGDNGATSKSSGVTSDSNEICAK